MPLTQMYSALPPFDPSTMLRSGAVALIIGHQNSGKTTLMCDLLKGRALRGGLIVEHTLNSRQYGTLADQADLFLEEFRESAADELIARQRRAGPDASDSFVILDDCIYHLALYLSRPIRNLFEHGRSLRTTTLIAQTYAMGLPPTVRTRIDWVFVFRESIRSNVRRIHEQYINGLSLSAFEALLRLPREDYDCLAIDYGNTGQIYRYRACCDRVPRPLEIDEFDPVTAIRPGDRCAFTGAGRKTPILCDLLARLPDLSAGYLVLHEDAMPPFQEYATLRDRVRTTARFMRYGHSLAQHLLDLSGASTNSFVILEDNCTHYGNVALDYLEAHRRELGITVFSSEPYMPADRPDFLFVTYPSEHRDYVVRSIHENMGIADRIPFREFCDLVHSLDYLRYECVVIERRTGRLWLYHPHEMWG